MNHIALVATEATEAAEEAAVPAEVWGIGALVVLFGLMALTLAFGNGRPHA